jgi:hypothetical protein
MLLLLEGQTKLGAFKQAKLFRETGSIGKKNVVIDFNLQRFKTFKCARRDVVQTAI